MSLERYRKLYAEGVYGYALLRFDRRARPEDRLVETAPAHAPAMRQLFADVFRHEMTPEHWQWKYGEGRGRGIALMQGDRMVAHYGGVTRRVLCRGETVLQHERDADRHVDQITDEVGDVAELDGLNHYIGMAPLGQAATLERSIAVLAIVALAMLLLASVFIQNRWAGFLALPVVFYPALFLADLYYWMNRFGQNLDPRAPLSSSVKPFTPVC